MSNSSIPTRSHQAETAIAGMWLFLATEVLFFGGLILAWLFCRHWQQAGFDAGARETSDRIRHDQPRAVADGEPDILRRTRLDQARRHAAPGTVLLVTASLGVCSWG